MPEELDIEIVALISDNPDAHALTRAKEASIQTFVIPLKNSRDEWNQGIIQTVVSLSADLVVSAGFMRILPPDFVNRFPTINSHPALAYLNFLGHMPFVMRWLLEFQSLARQFTGLMMAWTQALSLLRWKYQCCQEMMRPHFMRELRK